MKRFSERGWPEKSLQYRKLQTRGIHAAARIQTSTHPSSTCWQTWAATCGPNQNRALRLLFQYRFLLTNPGDIPQMLTLRLASRIRKALGGWCSLGESADETAENCVFPQRFSSSDYLVDPFHILSVARDSALNYRYGVSARPTVPFPPMR